MPDPDAPLGAAGVVLAGGRSSRMGTSKAGLAWEGSTLLARTCRVLRDAGLDPVIVVRAPGQDLPPLPDEVLVTEDPVEGLGPVQGVATGLAAAAEITPVAFVCSTDLPFLHAAFVRRVVLPLLQDPDIDAVIPIANGVPQPLAAAYRTSLAAAATRSVAVGQLRASSLVDHVRALRLDESRLLSDPGLRRADPDLHSLVNVNTAEELAAARRAAIDKR